LGFYDVAAAMKGYCFSNKAATAISHKKVASALQNENLCAHFTA
jgi:hypothetical protein